MARLRNSFVRTRTRPRKTSWSVGPHTGASGQGQSISASGAVIGTTNISIALDGVTLIRTRGELLLTIITAGGAGEGFVGAFGIGVATAAAIAAGITAVPTPVTEQDAENWIFHRYFSMSAPAAISAAGTSKEWSGIAAGSAVLRLEIDSKAMRKLDVFDGVYFALEVTEVGTATMEWNANCRHLFKLS